MKVFVKIFIGLFGTLLAACISLLVIAWYFEDQIADYAIKELNKQIRTKVNAEKIDFTILRKFPNASIRFKNAYVSSVSTDYASEQFAGINTDTLLFAEEIYLQLSLKPLFRNQFILQEVLVNKGKLNIYSDENGNTNWHFWKETDDGNKSDFKVDLQQVKLSGIKLLSTNLAKKTTIAGVINKSTLYGNLNSERYILDFILDGKLNYWRSDEINYLSDKEFSIRSKMNVTGNNFQITKSNLAIDGLNFIIDGNIANGEMPDLDLDISGKNLILADIYKSIDFIIPPLYRQKIKVRGNLTFNAEIKGKYSDLMVPEIKANFSLNGGWLTTPFSEQKFENINLQGYFSNGAQNTMEGASLEFENVSVKFGESKCSGNIKIANLLHPYINYDLSAELNLKDMLPFIKSKTVALHSGKVSIDAKINGSQSGLVKINNRDILDYEIDGSAELTDMMIGLTDENILIEHLNGKVNIGKYLSLNDLSMVISGNELSIQGRIDNWRNWLLIDNSKLWLDLNVYSGNLIVDKLIPTRSVEENTKKLEEYILPDKFFLKSRFWFDRFTWDKFSAANMYGDLKYRPRSLTFNGEFSAMGGDIKGSGFVDQKDNKDFSIRINSDLEKINIQTLFYCFNNFGQTYIQDKHLKGKLSGEVGFYSLFDKYLKVRKESILVETDIRILNGELINFEPMLGLSDFIDVKELQHIMFSTLENQVFIMNSEVLIPQMDIFSSAINISGSGIHRFDNQFNYKVNVELSDLLLNKTQKKPSEFEEHLITDDGLHRTKIYLKIDGTPEDYHVSYDRKEAVVALKAKLSDEKAELKSVLQEEFELFRKDTFEVKPVEEAKRDFFIKWEESDEKNADTVKTENMEKADKFVIEWDDDEADTTTLDEKKNEIFK